MSFIARLQRAREILEQQGRLSTRALERELGIEAARQHALQEAHHVLVEIGATARAERVAQEMRG